MTAERPGPTCASAPPLRFDRVGKRLGGREVLHEISFDCPPASITALLGPNGAGKSTTVALATGLRRPERGDIAAFGRRVGTQWSRRQVSVVLQEIGFPDAITVSRCLAFVAAQRERPGLGPDPARLSERLELGPLLPRRIGGLSGGERRKLAVALGLIRAPRLLILDEATTNLDEHTRACVWRLLRDYREDGGAVLVTSHILADIEAHADRVVALHEGRVLRAGSVAELRADLGGSYVSLRVAAERTGRIRAQVAGTGLADEVDTGPGPAAGGRAGHSELVWRTTDPVALVAALSAFAPETSELQVRPVPLNAMLNALDEPQPPPGPEPDAPGGGPAAAFGSTSPERRRSS